MGYWQVTPGTQSNNHLGSVISPSILITRPTPVDAQFADRLRVRLGCGVRIVLSPVMRIEATGPAVDTGAAGALIVTSRNALEFVPKTDLPVWVVGPQLAAAAREAGLNVVHEAPEGAALLDVIRAEGRDTAYLHIRGRDVAVDICGALNAAGFTCEETIVYRQEPEPLNRDARCALDGEEAAIIPLFSARSAQMLFEQGPFTAPLVIVAISKAVADTVPKAHADGMKFAARPDAEAMVDAIAEALEHAKPLEGQNRAQ